MSPEASGLFEGSLIVTSQIKRGGDISGVLRSLSNRVLALYKARKQNVRAYRPFDNRAARLRSTEDAHVGNVRVGTSSLSVTSASHPTAFSVFAVLLRPLPTFVPGTPPFDRPYGLLSQSIPSSTTSATRECRLPPHAFHDPIIFKEH